MSFKAKLEVAGKTYNVLNVNYSLAQETDPTGRPSSQTRGGRIEVTVESTGETDVFEWMTNSFERKDGKVVFIKRDSDATLKELNFTDGYVVKYRENFDSIGSNPLTETFTISAKTIKMGTGEHVNEWV
ncbi:phage tail protein [Apibacter muscae]|uniref:Phage tail protein n=1 Tax=Apibacter muscae TaxID=2509004 RepID=A0A563DC72_9FLAO|nr:type VI secretion system tube protein TssD [Apibacter muscae]TWP24081.1 phage tail protein [Apibacter muscae]TWP27722.1 phage tail protein [Apibacter muscae]TWP29542.1 phage tail protein [Apibacter muscae]